MPKRAKLEQQQANAEPEEQVDPRKAAVEAAIAPRQSTQAGTATG
ncbi:putative NADH:ubiquinone oxidoreductase, subu nit RnfC [Escherichia coli VL2874]|nr:putative NADH:ubiquinone oxidoreductase, subu nit RnfC [Escherichia coli VL2874]